MTINPVYFTPLIITLLGLNTVKADQVASELAQQTAQCLSAHITLETEPYRSGETRKYFILLSRLEGAREGMQLMQGTLKRLKQMASDSKIRQALQFLQQDCPTSDSYIISQKP